MQLQCDMKFCQNRTVLAYPYTNTCNSNTALYGSETGLTAIRQLQSKLQATKSMASIHGLGRQK